MVETSRALAPTTKVFVETIVNSVCTVVNAPAVLHEPTFDANCWAPVKDCLDSGWVSSVGSYVDGFEQRLSAFTGVPQAIAVVNGTAALHLAYRIVGVKAGDEVIVPSLTFVATANAVAYLGAIPHFVDCEPSSIGIDANAMRQYLSDISEIRQGRLFNCVTGRRIAAVVVTHVFGHSPDLNAILSVCNEFNLPLIEDAAGAIGSFYKGQHAGTVGHVGVLSFNGNKVITTGGGGALLTRDPHLAARAKHLSTTAKIPHKWEYCHDEIGYNYRLPNLNAALGCAQLDTLDDLLLRKRSLANAYVAAFTNIEGVGVLTEPSDSQSNYWLNALVLAPQKATERDAVLAGLNDAGVMSRPIWHPLNALPVFSHCPSMQTPVAKDLYNRVINVPSSPSLAKLCP